VGVSDLGANGRDDVVKLRSRQNCASVGGANLEAIGREWSIRRTMRLLLDNRLAKSARRGEGRRASVQIVGGERWT
jgi:hypothetical protein